MCLCMCVCQSLSGCCDESICSKYALESCQKRHGVSKETYLCVKRDLFVCQTRPICVSKETYSYVKSATAQILKSTLHQKFSKALSIVLSHSTCTRPLVNSHVLRISEVGVLVH
jgi:hypothetical protein